MARIKSAGFSLPFFWLETPMTDIGATLPGQNPPLAHCTTLPTSKYTQ
jgi:hypothetical protein